MRDSEILAMLQNECPMCGPADCACTATEQDQYREIQRLRLALADAIRRPMGVVPESADGLITQSDLEAAEQRRVERRY